MKLAIVGSRYFNDYESFIQVLSELPSELNDEITEIVSGGAPGTDTLARKYAIEIGVPIKEFYPDWNKHGKAAGPMRNTMIVDYCTHLIAFPSRTSRGTLDSINKAKKSDKLLYIHYID